MTQWISLLTTAAVLGFSQPTEAQGPAGLLMFDTLPVGDPTLTDVRGGQAPFAPLTASSLARIVDDNGRADLRQTGAVGKINMDVWWGTIGSELIAQNVRAAERP